jgi:hypothetical protein
MNRGEKKYNDDAAATAAQPAVPRTSEVRQRLQRSGGSTQLVAGARLTIGRTQLQPKCHAIPRAPKIFQIMELKFYR